MHQRCGWENHDPRRLCDQAMDKDQALRMNHPKEVKFVRMVSIVAIERVLLFFTVLRSSDEKGGYIQLITWNPGANSWMYVCNTPSDGVKNSMTHDVPACRTADQAGSTLYRQDVCIAITDGADLYRYEAYMLLKIGCLILFHCISTVTR